MTITPILDDIVMIPHPESCEDCCDDIFTMYLFTVHDDDDDGMYLQKHEIRCIRPGKYGLRACIESYNRENANELDGEYFLARCGNGFYRLTWNLDIIEMFLETETVRIKAMLYDHILEMDTVQDRFHSHLV